MKYLKLFFSITIFYSTSLFGAAGFFESYGIVNSTFYDLGATTANADMQGANLGEFDVSDLITIGGEIKTWKNSGSDVTGASLYYSIHQGTASSFNEVSYSWQSNISSSDQYWASNTSSTVSLSELSAGSYNLEFYATVSTNGFDTFATHYDNNGGPNYLANFTVVPEPSSFALIGSLISLGLVALRRKIRI